MLISLDGQTTFIAFRGGNMRLYSIAFFRTRGSNPS